MVEGKESLVNQLQEALPGFVGLDRDLLLNDVRVELVGRAGDGRLVLVHRVSKVDAAVLIDLLDLLSAVRTQAPLLARHVGTEVEAVVPLIVLVAEEVDERSTRRLAALDADSVHVLEVREIASERAHSTFLVAHGDGADGPATHGVAEQLAELDRTVRRRVEILAERLGRVDEEMALSAIDDRLEWRWRNHAICTVLIEDTEAHASVPGLEGHLLADDETLEVVVDEAIARWMAVTEEAEGLEAVEVRPPSPRPLVRPEELDALRE